MVLRKNDFPFTTDMILWLLQKVLYINKAFAFKFLKPANKIQRKSSYSLNYT